MKQLGTLDFSGYPVERHTHKHHVFTEIPGLGRLRWNSLAAVHGPVLSAIKLYFATNFANGM